MTETSAAETPKKHYPGVWILAAVLTLAGLAAYHNSFDIPFVFDDTETIIGNPHLRHWWSGWRNLVLGTVGSAQLRPVLNLTFLLNFQLGQTNPAGYHYVNLAIHILAALALFGLLRRALLAPPCRDRLGRDATALAFAISLLWLIHPLATSAVSYVTQRAESLASLFYLLTLYCLARSSDAKRPAPLLAASALAFVLGLGTKEMAATAPFAALLYDRAFLAGSFREALRARRRYYLALGAALALFLLGLALSDMRSGSVGFGLGISPLDYLRAQCYAVAHYLKLAFWPSPLIFSYPREISATWQDVAPQALLLLGLAAASLHALIRRSPAGFAGAFFFLVLAPTSSLIPIIDPIFEHRTYLALAAPISLAVIGVHLALASFPRGRLIALTLLIAASAGLCAATVQRNVEYHSIWEDTVAKAPRNPIALYNRAMELVGKKDLPGALALYAEAARYAPNEAKIFTELGYVYDLAGDTENAVATYRRAREISPDFVLAGTRLTFALINSARGKPPEVAAKLTSEAVATYDDLAARLTRAGIDPDSDWQMKTLRKMTLRHRK